jgi:hypothetical protein
MSKIPSSTSRDASMSRTAKVDQMCVDYWTELFKDSGYGKLLVAEMPKRMAAVAAGFASRRTAGAKSTPVEVVVVPHALGKSASGNPMVSAFARVAQGPRLLIQAEFDPSSGEIVSQDALVLSRE